MPPNTPTRHSSTTSRPPTDHAPFDSKDDPVATAVADQLRAQCEAVGAAVPGQARMEQILRASLGAAP